MQIKNPHKVPCSIPGCNSIYIARKKDWICGFHLKVEYNKKTLQGQKNYFKGKQKPIRKVSKSMEVKLKEYSKLKKEFMSLPENKYCPVFPHLKTTDVHHMKGRVGSLLLDTRFFLAVSRDGHKKIEQNPIWAKEKGFSLNRF